MTITAVTEVWKGDTTSGSANGERDYTRHFRVYSDDVNESPVTVRLALPGGAHPNDASAYASKKSASRIDESRLIWDGEVEYQFKLQDPNTDAVELNPKVRWTSSLAVISIARDLFGRPIVNSAGDYFDPPVEREITRLTANVQFNAVAPPVGLLDYSGAVNNAPISINGVDVVAERAKVTAIDIGEVQKDANDNEYQSVTFAVECRSADDDGFDLELLDQGFRIRDTVTKAGTLSTRTSDYVGVLTMASGHGIVTGQYLDLYWNTGADVSVGMRAGTVSGLTVPVTGGTEPLPASSTAITIQTAGQKDVLITDEDGDKARPSSPILLDGHGQRLVAAGGVFLPYVITRKLDLTVFPGITG